MKSVLLLLPLISYALAIPLESRQLSSLMSAFAAKQKALKVEQATPTMPRDGVKRLKLTYGPYKLKASRSTEKFGNGMSMDPDGTAYNYVVEDIPRDITVLATNTSLVYEDGSPADLASGLYNHHTFYADTAKSNPAILSCSNGKVPTGIPLSVFMSTAEEYGGFRFTTLDAKFNSGYYLAKDDVLYSVVDLVNYTNATKTVYVQNDMHYVEGKTPGALEASMQIISLGICNGTATVIRPPEGQKQFSLQSDEMKLTRGGQVLQMWGHLHDGGANLVTRINGTVACDSRAVYGGAGSTMGGMGGMGGMGKTNETHAEGEAEHGTVWETMASMTQCRNFRVEKGDTFSLEAFFDLEAHPARQHTGGGEAEEMAIVAMFFAYDA